MEADGLRSHVVYKFVCAGCSACYVGTSPHVLESTYSVTEPLTFSGIRKILRTVALCVKQAGRDRYEIIF